MRCMMYIKTFMKSFKPICDISCFSFATRIIIKMYKQWRYSFKLKYSHCDSKIITNMMSMPSNYLFQIPFTLKQFEGYKDISKFNCNDCLFHALAALGLRPVAACQVDSLNMYIKNESGVEVSDVAKYISTIFEQKIQVKFHKKPSWNELENGCATFVCIGFQNYFNDLLKLFRLYDSHYSHAHFLIIYKLNNIFYFYDPKSRIVTTDMTYFCDIHEYITNYVSYHNIDKKFAYLNKNKMNTTIKF